MKQITDQYITKIENDLTVLYRTHGKYPNEQLFELSEPTNVKEFEHEPTQTELLHEIELNDWTRWNKDLTIGQCIEISEDTYNQLLNCLPPRNWKGNYFEVSEAHHHDNKGKAIYRACWKDNGLYYTGYPKY
jgi:hypothetical protein